MWGFFHILSVRNFIIHPFIIEVKGKRKKSVRKITFPFSANLIVSFSVQTKDISARISAIVA